MIKGIVFDLEGTVVDVEAAHHQAHILVGREIGVNLTIEEAMAQIPGFIGGGDPVVMQGLKDMSGTPLTVQELVARKMEYYEHFLAAMAIKPRPGFVEFLAALKGYGLPVSIGSLTPKSQAAVLLERSGVGALIGEENIVLREHVANIKPAPDVFLETARRMGVDPKHQLVFEDSPRGIQAAIAAGSKAIGMPVYNRPEATVPLIQAGACRLFLDWREINPEALINNLNAWY